MPNNHFGSFSDMSGRCLKVTTWFNPKTSVLILIGSFWAPKTNQQGESGSKKGKMNHRLIVWTFCVSLGYVLLFYWWSVMSWLWVRAHNETQKHLKDVKIKLPEEAQEPCSSFIMKDAVRITWLPHQNHVICSSHFITTVWRYQTTSLSDWLEISSFFGFGSSLRLVVFEACGLAVRAQRALLLYFHTASPGLAARSFIKHDRLKIKASSFHQNGAL